MLDEQETRNALIADIAADLWRYNSGNLKDFGSGIDRLDGQVSRPLHDPNFWVAFSFWEAWIDQINHGFGQLFYGIPEAEWPRLGAVVLEALQSKKEIAGEPLLEQFDSRNAPRPPPSLDARLYHWLNDTREEFT
jgi:hypothetical protein